MAPLATLCNKFGGALLEAIVPQRCAGCGGFGSGLCAGCFEALTATAPVHRFGRGSVPLITALGIYDGRLRSTILAIKFGQRKSAAHALGAALAISIPNVFDCIVAVPLHVNRLRWRGFNQAHEIARGIAVRLGAPVLEHIVVRSRHTQPQTSLRMEQRRLNVEAAFTPGPQVASIVKKRVLLVDDVLTTGATFGSCAEALRQAGASLVGGAVLAMKQ